MYKAYKFRPYPSDKQKKMIHKTFECSRFVYNHFLNECKENGYKKAYDMCKDLKELENENDRDINASINIMFEGLKLHYQN